MFKSAMTTYSVTRSERDEIWADDVGRIEGSLVLLRRTAVRPERTVNRESYFVNLVHTALWHANR